MKITMRSLAQCVHSPSVDGGSIAMASPAGFGLDGRAATCTEVRNSNPSGVRESNRVSNWLFRMVAILAVLLNGLMFVYAAPIKFLKSFPENESLINSFDFTLEFDISEALEIAATEKPGIVYGLGYMGSSSLNATLYKGDIETGTILGQVNSSNFTGKSNGFKDNGNTIQVSFDSTLPIIANQEYTVVITNKFYLYQSGKITRLASTEADFSSDPITLKFKGQSSEKPQLDIISSNIGDDALASISQIEFKLNSAFQINSGAEVFICEGDKIVAKTSDLIVSSTDNKVLVARFNDVPLLLGHTYTIELPNNSLTHVDDSTVGNFVYKVNVNGSQTYKIALTSSKVDVDSNGIPTSVTFIYDLPDGTTLNGLNFTGSRDGLLSIDGSDSFSNFDTKYSFAENGKGLKWDLSSVRFEPATKYSFKKDGSTIFVFDANNNSSSSGHLKEYSGEDASISFMTPSVEEAGFMPLEFSEPKIISVSEESAYSEGMECESLTSISLGLKDLFYYIGNKKNNLHTNPDLEDKNICNVYEISPEGDKLLGSYSFSTSGSMDTGYMTAICKLRAIFYEGKKYKFVIPEGYFTAYADIFTGSSTNDLSKVNYIRSKEMVYTFTGTTPEKVELISCNVVDNSEKPSLYNIVWTFKGTYELAEDVTTIRKEKTTLSGAPASPVEYPAILSTRNGMTSVMIEFVDKMTGDGLRLLKGETSTFIMPKGLIRNTFNENIVNEEISLRVKGGEEAGLQKVNVNLSVNGLHSASHSAIKGERYSLAMAPEENWKVESVMHGDKKLNNVNGTFITEPLNEDANITANLEYNGQWATNDKLTDVWTIEANNVRIFRDSNMIVVEGVTPANTINVYSVAGVLINSTRVSEGNDTVTITVAPNQVYIVSVDGVGAKIQM